MFNSYMTTTVDRDCAVDAWGTVTTPMGTLNTIRNRSTTRTILDTYFMGALVWSDTSDLIGFSWLVPRYGPIVSVVGGSLVQDSLIANPLCYSLTTLSAVSTEEAPGCLSDKPLNAAILGNPTSLPFSMQVELGRLQHASVEVYDVSGRLIHRSENVTSGLLQWDRILDDGRRIPAGVYIVSLRADVWTRSLTVSIM